MWMGVLEKFVDVVLFLKVKIRAIFLSLLNILDGATSVQSLSTSVASQVTELQSKSKWLLSSS